MYVIIRRYTLRF